MSAHQLHRILGVTLKDRMSSWAISASREAMRVGGLAPMGGEGEVVEVDETYIGKKEGAGGSPGRFPARHKMAVLALVVDAAGLPARSL